MVTPKCVMPKPESVPNARTLPRDSTVIDASKDSMEIHCWVARLDVVRAIALTPLLRVTRMPISVSGMVGTRIWFATAKKAMQEHDVTCALTITLDIQRNLVVLAKSVIAMAT